MVVAVDDELCAVAREHRAEFGAVEEPLEATPRLAARRMMDHHHAKCARRLVEQTAELRKLPASKPSRRHEGRGRYRARERDQRDRPAPPQEWKRHHGVAWRVVVGRVVAAHIVAPMELRMAEGGAHIGVVIARHQGHVVWRSERRQEIRGRPELGRKRDVDEIAGHRDVIRRLRLEVGDDVRQHVTAMNQVALAPPVEIPGCTLAHELVPSRLRQRRKMRIGKMREGKHSRSRFGWARAAGRVL